MDVFGDYYGDYYGDFFGDSDIFDYFMSPDTYSPKSQMGANMIVLIFCAAFLAFVVAAVFYVFNALALHRIGVRRNMKNTALAFVPVLNIYFLGKVADDIYLTMNRRKNYSGKILCLLIGAFASGFALAVTMLTLGIFGVNSQAVIVLLALLTAVLCACAVAAAVFMYIALYIVYKEYVPEYSVLFETLSIIYCAHPFCLFAIRNNKSGYEKWLETREVTTRPIQQEQPAEIVFDDVDSTAGENKHETEEMPVSNGEESNSWN